MPHEHDDFACSKQRPALKLPAPGILKRARSGTFASSSSPTDPPCKKRRRTESDFLLEQQALPAAQERLTSQCPSSKAASTAEAITSLVPHENLRTSDTASAFHQGQTPRPPDNSSQLPLKMDPSKRQRARDKLKSQFDLEILLKHDELRLIEQELGKTQIALEQLRRCRQIPFPGDADSPVTFDQAISGTGPAVARPRALSQPAHPAPYGVTDGPYSRHYASWLLPHHMFDSQPSSSSRQSVGGKSSISSNLRSGNEAGVPHRRQRTSTSGLAHSSVLEQTPAPKDKGPHGPQVLRRPDGQLVKLKCKDCGKEDVSSVQGFLNHCRIAHQNDMKSHADAANICGVPTDGASDIVPASALSEVGNTSPSQPRTNTLVNPLITAPVPTRPMSLLGNESAGPLPSEDFLLQLPSLNPEELKTQGLAGDSENSSFLSQPPALIPKIRNLSELNTMNLASPLSSLALRSGIGSEADIQRVFANAKQKIDLDQVEPLISDSELEDEQTASRATCEKPQHNSDARKSSVATSRARAPPPGVRMPAKPPSIQVPTQPPPLQFVHNSQASHEAGWLSSSPYAPSTGTMLSPYTFPSHVDVQMTDLSPRTNPPGLVTDHEDDDEDVEDEIKSVVANSNDGRGDIHIYSDNCDVNTHAVAVESKDIMPQWRPDLSTGGSEPAPPTQTVEKKRRGRPKKGKEKVHS